MDPPSDKSSASAFSDPAFEQRVWRKIDFCVLPVVAMFYFVSFLDRVNLGNARVAGLQKDLRLTNHQYSVALTVTYVPYILAELPSNLLLKRIGPNVMLPTMVVLWGCVTALQGVVSSFGGLIACRFFLGLLEGGVVPGLVLYLSCFYPRHMLQARIAIFFCAASLAGAFSGLAAYGIVRMKSAGHRPAWAWIFIIEGAFTSVFGLVSYALLPRSPAHARFLNHEEKEYAISKLKEGGATATDSNADKFSWGEVLMAFRLPHVWLVSITSFCQGTVFFSLAYFTPSIVHSLGYTQVHAQLMSVPPFGVAFVVSVAGSLISDRYHCRGLVSIFAFSLCAIGFSVFLGTQNHAARYGSLFLYLPAICLATPTLSTWGCNNVTPHTRRATAIALVFIMSNMGGILATWLLGTLSKPPHHVLGAGVLLSLSAVAMFLSALNVWYLWDQNRRKEQIRVVMRMEEEKAGLGDQSAWFVYAL